MKRSISIAIILSMFFNACASNKIHKVRMLPKENGHDQAISHSIKKVDAGKCWGIGCDESFHDFPAVVEYQRTNVHSVISIPVQKIDHTEQIPTNFPEILKHSLPGDICHTGVEGIGCGFSYGGDRLEIFLSYETYDAGFSGCAAVITDAFGSFLLIPILMAPFHLALCLSPRETYPLFEQSEKTLISFPSYKGYGGISFNYKTTPSTIYLSCDSKECSVVDEYGKAINKIYIEKSYYIDEEKIKNLF